MNRLKILGIAVSGLLSMATILPPIATAATITIDFDGVTTGYSVNEYYNGGMDGNGVVGPDYGVSFYGFATWEDYGETSEPNMVYTTSDRSYVNVEEGFYSLSLTNGLYDSSVNVLSVYSGLNGTGTVLGSVQLTGNPVLFTHQSVSFSGLAHSFVIDGSTFMTGIDDVVIVTPEPGTIALLGIGTLAAAAVRRKELTVEA